MTAWFVVPCVTGCGHPVSGALQAAAERRSPPDDLVVVYDDRHEFWGGQRVTVWGDGAVEVLRYNPGPEPRSEVARGRVPVSQVVRLVERLVEIRAWEHRAGDPLPAAARRKLPPLDNGRVRLTVRVGEASSTIWEWANDVEVRRRIVLVRQQLERLLLRARLDPSPRAAGG